MLIAFGVVQFMNSRKACRNLACAKNLGQIREMCCSYMNEKNIDPREGFPRAYELLMNTNVMSKWLAKNPSFRWRYSLDRLSPCCPLAPHERAFYCGMTLPEGSKNATVFPVVWDSGPWHMGKRYALMSDGSLSLMSQDAFNKGTNILMKLSETSTTEK